MTFVPLIYSGLRPSVSVGVGSSIIAVDSGVGEISIVGMPQADRMSAASNNGIILFTLYLLF